MKAQITVDVPSDDASWQTLTASFNAGQPSDLLNVLVARLRSAGAQSVLSESFYIDRDFSAAYAAFYATLFRPFRKYCQRVHFFANDLTPLLTAPDTISLQELLEDRREGYLGSIVLRPLTHAPVSVCLISAQGLTVPLAQEVTVRSEFTTHVLGVELSVQAMPLAQQDRRTGACAQAAMWMAGRHFYSRHSAQWFSMPDITEIALNPIDSAITRSLPAGSEWLTQDNMVRALRAMGRHPVMYAPDAAVNDVPTWQALSPREIVSRYVDSGMPVILALQSATDAIGHGVVAVGIERVDPKTVGPLPPRPTDAEFLTHFLVNDDQRGAYCRLPIAVKDKTAEYPFCLETDLKFILVPLPAKVFMTAEAADIISENMLAQVAARRSELAATALGPDSGWDVDSEFYSAVGAGTLIRRTYLTYGWKYKARMLRNNVPEQFKAELLLMQLPRYVWVTEYSVPDDAQSLNPCERQIRAHVVVDGTGSPFGEAPLILDAPGLSVFWQYNLDNRVPVPVPVIVATASAQPYWPKIRGDTDYSTCAIVPN
jgi:hypothetical protein